MDLKIGNGLRCCYSTEYSLKCRVMCPRCIQYIYISKYETANRYSVCYALHYVLDLCALCIRRRLWKAASLTIPLREAGDY